MYRLSQALHETRSPAKCSFSPHSQTQPATAQETNFANIYPTAFWLCAYFCITETNYDSYAKTEYHVYTWICCT